MTEKQLASFHELRGEKATQFMQRLNCLARDCGLQQYQTYGRIWEYPWVWFRLKAFRGQNRTVLDIGSEVSAFQWYLATQGFRVIVSDVTAAHWNAWKWASHKLNVPVRRLILDAQDLDLPTASVDIYLSVSVIEHVPNKEKAIAEAARVLRSGGLMVMTFDICEPDMKMTFPKWNGRALTMREFDDLFRNCRWFQPGLAELPWNTNDIQEYLNWHRKTAPHHNYVTGAAVVRRNNQPWKEPSWKDHLRGFKGKVRTPAFVGLWYIQHNPRAFSYKVARWVIFTLKKPLKRGWTDFKRFTIAPLETHLTSPKFARLLAEPLFWIMDRRRKRHEICISLIKRFVPRPVKEALRQLILVQLEASPQELLPCPLESLPHAPDLFHDYRYLYQHPALERKPGGWLYKGGFYPDYLTVGGASHAISRKALKFCQGKGVDIGAGLWPLQGAIPVDIWRGQSSERTVSAFYDNSLDFVFSSHCLEHIDNWQKALGEWVKKLKLKGFLFLYLPHPDCAIWHPGSPFVGDGHKWIPTPEIVKQGLQGLGCEISEFDDGPDAMQSFYVCGQKDGLVSRNGV